MSISVGGLATAQGTARSELMIIAAIAFMATIIGAFAGVVPPRRVAGPVRLPDDSPPIPFASVLFGSFGFYLFAALLLLQFWPHIAMHNGSGNPDIAHSEFGLSLLASLPPLAGLAGAWIGDYAIYPMVRQRLGLGWRSFRTGLLWGIAAAVLVVPLMFLAEAVLELIYQARHFQHPQEHAILKAMGESPSLFVRVALIVGACVIAPLWEETLFRGHLQTLLNWSFARLAPEGSKTHRALAAWMAIFLTSLLFAVQHERWEWPIIFLLAICLGYAYERTGNLWISIIIHAAFNTVSTVIFLYSAGAN